MTDKHIPFRLIYVFPRNQTSDCLIVGQIIPFFIRSCNLLYHGWFHKRQQIKIHRTIRILQYNFFHPFFRTNRWHADHMKLLPCQHISIAVHTNGAVMVAADHHNHQVRQFFRQFRNKSIQHCHGFRRRNCLIVNISCDHQRIRLCLHRQLRDLM